MMSMLAGPVAACLAILVIVALVRNEVTRALDLEGGTSSLRLQRVWISMALLLIVVAVGRIALAQW